MWNESVARSSRQGPDPRFGQIGFPMWEALWIRFGILLLLFFLACGEELTGPAGTNPLAGVWEETFEWMDPYGGVLDPVGGAEITRTSTLIFSGNRFTLTVLPHRGILIVTPDTVYTGFADDTLYTGTYQLTHDTISFYREGSDLPNRFSYRFSPEGLHLAQLPIRDSGSGPLSFPLTSFLWANTHMKYSGVFSRVE